MRVVSFEYEIGPDLTLKSYIELITFRDPKVVIDRTTRNAGARNIRGKTGLRIARKSCDYRCACGRYNASKLVNSCVTRGKTIGDSCKNRRTPGICGGCTDRV